MWSFDARSRFLALANCFRQWERQDDFQEFLVGKTSFARARIMLRPCADFKWRFHQSFSAARLIMTESGFAKAGFKIATPRSLPGEPRWLHSSCIQSRTRGYHKPLSTFLSFLWTTKWKKYGGAWQSLASALVPRWGWSYTLTSLASFFMPLFFI